MSRDLCMVGVWRSVLVVTKLTLFLKNCMDGSDRPAILVLGNKIDKESERAVATVTGEQAAKEFGTKFAEVSALTGDGVEEVRNCPLIRVPSEL